MTDVETVTITVGEDGTHCDVDKSLLCSKSKYSNNLLNGPFKEASQQELKASDVSLETFLAFIEWMHSGSITMGEVAAALDAKHWKEQKIATVRGSTTCLTSTLLFGRRGW